MKMINRMFRSMTVTSMMYSARALSSISSSSGDKSRLLILGGSGFLGSEVAKRAVASQKFDVSSFSRRGKPESNAIGGVEYISGDATDEEMIKSVISSGSYDAVVHCIGLLFDSDSGLDQFNVLVSGSGSILKKGATYDDSKCFRNVHMNV